MTTTATVQVFNNANVLVGSGFASLRDAVIAANANGGGSIVLGAGVVDVTTAASNISQVEVTTNISVSGAGTASTRLVAQVDTDFNAQVAGAMILVDDAKTFNMSNLTVDGNNTGDPDANGAQDVDVREAILYNGGSGTLSNIAFTNIVVDDDLGPAASNFSAEGRGVVVQDSTVAPNPGTPNVVNVLNSTFSNIGRVGIQSFDADTQLTVNGVTYTGKGNSSPFQFDDGVEVFGGTVTISNSNFTHLLGTKFDPVNGDVGSVAIVVGDFFGGNPNVNISSTTITDSSNGVVIQSVNPLGGTPTVTFGSGNNFATNPDSNFGVTVIGDPSVTNTVGVQGDVQALGDGAGTIINGSNFDDQLFNSVTLNPDGSFTANDDLAADTLNGFDGKDFISSGVGDTVKAGPGDDTVELLGKPASLDGGTGTDTAIVGASMNFVGVPVTGIEKFSVREGFTADFSALAGPVTVDVLDTLMSTTGATIVGTGAGDTITGGNGFDFINAGGGNDRVEGGPGADNLDGGPGTNTLSYEHSAAGVNVTINGGTNSGGDAQGDFTSNFQNIVGSSQADTLIGDGAVNRLEGGLGGDYLIGLGGNDLLLGGVGTANTLQGGTGNDLYIVEVKGDTVVEFAAEGLDTVQTNLGSFTLPSNVEDLVHSGSSDFTGIGNGLNNTLVGGTGTNYLIGLGGNDTLIDGGAKPDTLQGGPGNDIYAVQNAGDTIVEFNGTGEGVDTVETFLSSFTLRPGVENLTFVNNAAHTGIGTTEDNTFKGAAGTETWTGGGGDDVYDYRTPGNGFDIITDFNANNVSPEHDTVDLRGRGLTFGQLALTSVGDGTTVGIPGGDAISLQHVATNSVDAGDFFFT